MASSVYVYKSLDEYKKYYRGKDDQLIHQIPIIDMYVDVKKKKLFVITNQDMETKKQNIDFFRTLVHVRSESLTNDVVSNNEFNVKLVQHDKLLFNGKTGDIEFFPRKVIKPEMVYHIDRCLGGAETKRYDMQYDYRYYDFAQDRINLILGESRKSIWNKLNSYFSNIFSS